ncbi:hypothetical protein QCA50_003788 [Cerrena zonata]|uniref:GH18 domain-containing protein n=1 Tax=Cerrena zonata TaxID=2478898 RepID=A0AAW0GHJ6_9APHY
MNYDISGPWLTYVGPNAPLDDSCAPAANQQGSATGAIKAWTTAGVPSHQLVLGVPAYGHSYIVAPSDGLTSNDTETPIIASFPAFDKNQHPKGDKWDDGEGVDECGVQQTNGGNFNFIGLIEAGMLFPNGTATAAVDYRFDECSQTPYLYNETSQLMVSFDDAKSFSAKGNFIKENNLRGFAIWESAGDNNDILLNSIRTAAGFDEDC